MYYLGKVEKGLNTFWHSTYIQKVNDLDVSTIVIYMLYDLDFISTRIIYIGVCNR